MYSEILNQSHINNIVDYYPTGIDKLGIYQGKEIDDFRKPQWVNKILDPEFIGVQNRETTWTEVASNPFFRQGRENGEAAFVSFNLEDKGSLTLLWAFSKPEIAETIQGIIQDASGAVDDFLGFAASELSGVKFNQLTGGERVNDGLLPSPLLQTKYILHHDKFRTREHLEKHRGYLEQIGKTASKLYTQQLKTLAKQRLNLTLEIDKKGKYQISEFKDNLHHKKLEKHFESKGRNIQNERISQYSDETTQKLWKSEVTRRELSYQQLHTEWTAEANKSKLNITHLTNIYADRKTFLFQAPQIIREWQIKNEAIKKAFEQSPYITKDKLVTNLADASLKHNISSNKILEIANRYLHSNRVYKVNETEYVNHQILKKEEQNLKLVKKLHNQKNRFFLGLGNLSKSTVNKVSKSLGTEEKRAFNEITSKGMLKVLNTGL